MCNVTIQTHSRKVFRANLDDVENLSYGKGAKKQRGTGSRFTCHRLNRDERRIFDQAKRDGFLTVRGTGYRKNRKGSPVGNTFRQRCDALAKLCVGIEKRSESDRVVIDFSTLRVWNDVALVSFLLEAVFRSKHPELYEALIRNNDDDPDCNSSDREESSRSNTKLKNEIVIEIENSKVDGAATATATATATASSSVVVENTTRRPIHWEAAKTKPIWGVEERLLVVTCDREEAKSIARDVVKMSNSIHFARLQADAEMAQARDANEPLDTTEISKPIITPTSCEENTPTTKNPTASTTCNDKDIDCIDWNDI